MSEIQNSSIFSLDDVDTEEMNNLIDNQNSSIFSLDDVDTEEMNNLIDNSITDPRR